eukprot:Nitzschia sp. Nitz4//scaffold10_size219509//106507//108807//NITZ4_001430-RA/size219509-processed-gene-0.132-mRNA-1//-1//CDS//3329532926//5071//frame0
MEACINHLHNHSNKKHWRYFCLRIVLCCCLTLGYAAIWASPKFFPTEESLSFNPTIVTNLEPEHDPSWLRKHPPAFQSEVPLVCNVPPGQGEEGPDGLRGLYKIKTSENGPVPPVRLMCLVYTHSNQHDVLQSIAETWAPACDGFLAVSNVTDPNLGAFRVPHNGTEAYENMWNKVQAMWQFVYENYLDDYDWFHIGGDDMFVIPDNIKRTAANYNLSKPWMLGGSIVLNKPRERFCGGAAGYTLNSKAVRALVERFPNECPSELGNSKEDLLVGKCLGGIGVLCEDTNDADQEMRYHVLDVQYHSNWTISKPSNWQWKPLLKFHNIIANQSLLAQISNTSVSFHLDKGTIRSLALDRGMRRYHAILEDLCGEKFSRYVRKAATCDETKRGVPPIDAEPKVTPVSIPKYATRRAPDDEELLEGWKVTEDMKKMLDSSSWLHQQLQDGGLRNLISEVVASGDPESLMAAQQKYPRLPVFLDKLLLLAGVLERDTAEDSGDEETLQECLERDWNGDDLPPALTLKHTLRKRLPEFPPVDDGSSSSADQDKSSDANESSDDDSSANDEDDSSRESE